MEKLSTIQKRNNLNEVFRGDDAGAGGASHFYLVVKAGAATVLEDGTVKMNPDDIMAEIGFQHGPRKEEGSVSGVVDQDLLEMVLDRLKAFNKGEYATRENACAITHIEEALMGMNKRAEDRFERGVLGTMKK